MFGEQLRNAAKATADGKMLRAVGSVLKAGRRLFVVQSNIYSVGEKKEKLIATMLGTMVPSIADT